MTIPVRYPLMIATVYWSMTIPVRYPLMTIPVRYPLMTATVYWSMTIPVRCPLMIANRLLINDYPCKMSINDCNRLLINDYPCKVSINDCNRLLINDFPCKVPINDYIPVRCPLMTISCDCSIVRNKEVRCSRSADSIQNSFTFFISNNKFQLRMAVLNDFQKFSLK